MTFLTTLELRLFVIWLGACVLGLVVLGAYELIRWRRRWRGKDER